MMKPNPKPYNGYPRRIHASQARPIVYCANPGCGAKLSRRKIKYCDEVCRKEHLEIQKRERRPQEVHCANPKCGRPLDPLSRDPYAWRRSDLHFCDTICADEYRRGSGFYQQIAGKGAEAIAAYKEKHGKVHNHDERSEATRKNNLQAPPKAKHFFRSGKVWGYDARIVPNKQGDGYVGYLPELLEIGEVEARTAKEALKLLRARFSEIRAQARNEDRD